MVENQRGEEHQEDDEEEEGGANRGFTIFRFGAPIPWFITRPMHITEQDFRIWILGNMVCVLNPKFLLKIEI